MSALYHLYAEDGFEGAFRSLERGKAAARRGAKRRGIEYRLYESDSSGRTGNGHGRLVFDSSSRGPGRPALNPGGGDTAPVTVRLAERHHEVLRDLIAAGRGTTLADAIRYSIEQQA